jgi:4-amino-4-deoxy-L-arabinose transferase-like glycosyltransferase
VLACAFALILVAWVCLVRGPFLEASPINHDDSLYWLFGTAWLHGSLPYTQYWDLKPPGLFLLYAAASAAFGDDIAGIRMIAMGFIWATAIGLYILGTRHFGSRVAGAIAAALFVPYTIVWCGLACEPDLFLPTFTVFAAILVLDVTERDAKRPYLRLFGAGLLMGAAFTLKQTAVFEGAFLFFYLVVRRGDLRQLGAYAVGTATAPLLFAAYFAAHGLMGVLWDSTILSALKRTGGDVSLSQAPARFVILLLPAAPLALAAAVSFVERRSLLPTPSRTGDARLRFIAAWIGLAILGILLMHASSQYYFLPLLAPLCLVSGLVLAIFLRRGLGSRAIAATVILAMLAYPFVYFPHTLEAELGRSNTPKEISNYLKYRSHGRSMSLYVVDYDLLIYQASGLHPLTRYPLPMHLICPFAAASINSEREIAAIMARKPDFMVVTQNRHRLLCEQRERAQLAFSLGGPAYRLDRVYRDPMSMVEVWERR